MSKQNQYLMYVMEKLQPHGPIRSRAMFGGYGIYYNDVIFAVIVKDELYFRIDDLTKRDYEESFNYKPFVYDGMKKTVTMPYYTLPKKMLSINQILAGWIKKRHIRRR